MLRLIIVILPIIFLSCKKESPVSKPEHQIYASKNASLNSETIKRHLQELSSDKYMGRMPCTEGGKMAAQYINDEIKKLGLKPGNGDSYKQEVPLLTIDGEISNIMSVTTGSKTMNWTKGKDFVVHSERKVDRVDIKNSELVFCGYGIVDPSRNWNDYAGIDMTGKTAVILINDPGYGGDDPDFFNGDIMTYAGRWDYKYDIADAQGADGLIIIHTTPTAGYPWFVVESSWTGPQQGLSGIDRSKDCGIKGWITLEKARQLFEECGLNITEEIKASRRQGFKPKSMGATVSVSVDNSFDECISHNVIGIIEGNKQPDEYVIYTAHWDHIGVGKVVEGDSIYNGALDNASGVATLLGIAEAFSLEENKPDRSIIFLFVTAEEQGLLGSEYYVENPLYPLTKTVCNLNLDGVNPAGLMKDLTITGIGYSDMDTYAKTAASKQGRYILEEQEPEKGYFFRSDHFNFVKKGIPALYAEGAYDHAEKGKEYAKEFRDGFVAQRYHAPSDEYDADSWNMDGMLQDGQLYYDIGQTISSSREWPKWNEHSEFQRPQ